MGVRGLETFMEKHSNAAQNVDIIQIIRQYKINEHSTPVIVVDGMAVMRFIYKFKKLPFIYGGQMKEYEETLKDFINTFLNEGAELAFYFDGPCAISKRETWVKRRLATLQKVYALLDSLESGKSVWYHEKDTSLSILPGSLKALTVFIAKKYGCKVFSSTRDCDLEIAEYAAQNKCMAILSQDSDFVIFNAARYYLSMKNLIFVKNRNYCKMTTKNYDSQKLATCLGITKDQLPLFATLLGNDYVSTDDLKAFHRRMLRRRGKDLDKWIDFRTLFAEVSHFIKSYNNVFEIDTQSLEEIAEKVFSDKTKSSLIQESILSYSVTAGVFSDPGPPTSTDENWNNILKEVNERHKNSNAPSIMYGVIVLQEYSCSTCIEDYRRTDLPASQTLLKPLREKLYGILLFEKPEEDCHVKEMVVCGENSLDEPVLVKGVKPNVHHPGLMSLWGGTSQEERWKLVGDIFGFDYLKIKALPPQLIIPAITIRYINERVTIEKWELRAIVASAVLVHIYNADFLSKIYLDGCARNTRPIRLYTLLTRSYSTTQFIFNCLGDPIPVEMLSPSNYQDGKLFHHKYNHAQREQNDLELCDRKEVSHKSFIQTMEFILASEKSFKKIKMSH